MSKTFNEPDEHATLHADYLSVSANCNGDSGCFLKVDEKPICIARDVCGTPLYMTPEMHYGRNYSFDVDYWGMGVTLYRMLTGRVGQRHFACGRLLMLDAFQMPFGEDAESRAEMAKNISADPLEFKDDDNIDPITRDFLQGVLAKDPAERLTVDEIKIHPYFWEM